MLKDSASTRSRIAPPAIRRLAPLAVSRCRIARPGPPTRSIRPRALHASGEGAEGLVGLERQQGKVVEGGSGVLVQMPQGVPLHKADVKGGQRRVGLSVVPHLQPLHA